MIQFSPSAPFPNNLSEWIAIRSTYTDPLQLMENVSHLVTRYPRTWQSLSSDLFFELLDRLRQELRVGTMDAGVAVACVDVFTHHGVSPICETHHCDTQPSPLMFAHSIMLSVGAPWQPVYDRLLRACGDVTHATALIAEQWFLYNVRSWWEVKEHRAVAIYHPHALRALFWRKARKYHFDAADALACVRAYGLTEAALAYRPTPRDVTPLSLALQRINDVEDYYGYDNPSLIYSDAPAALVQALLEGGADVHATTPLSMSDRERIRMDDISRCTAVGELLHAAANAIIARKLAVAMALHPRIGGNSLLGLLDASLVRVHLMAACHVLSPGALDGDASIAYARVIRYDLWINDNVRLLPDALLRPRIGLHYLFCDVVDHRRTLTPELRADFRARYWLQQREPLDFEHLEHTRGLRWLRRLALTRATRVRARKHWGALLRACAIQRSRDLPIDWE